MKLKNLTSLSLVILSGSIVYTASGIFSRIDSIQETLTRTEILLEKVDRSREATKQDMKSMKESLPTIGKDFGDAARNALDAFQKGE